MPAHADAQATFAAALLDAEHAVPDGLTSRSGPRPLRRFNVYRNNVFVSLIEVLEGRYPAVRRLVGDDFFRATAHVFIERHPPRTPVILAYGAGFAEFLEGFEPAAELPYLPDVARLELAWNEAYHAADAVPLGPEGLAALSPDMAAGAVLTLHPSLRLVPSPHPIVTIWTAMTDEGECEAIDLGIGREDALVIRPRLDVEVRRLPEGAARFIGAMSEGASLLAAAETAEAAAPQFDLQANLAGLIQCGAVCDVGIAT